MGTTVRHLLVAMFSMLLFAVCASASGTACGIVRSGDGVELQSPHFVFRLSTARGLRAESWQNRLTGRTLGLGGGAEVEFDIGLPDQPLNAPVLRVIKTPVPGAACEAAFELASGEPKATVSVRYQWNEREPVLRKFVTITNAGSTPWERLLNVRLGSYQTAVAGDDADPDFPVWVSDTHESTKLVPYEDPAGRERGYPAYAAREFFLSLAHPAGWTTRKGGGISMRQYPGRTLGPGQKYECMEAVYGVSKSNEARAAFRAYLTTRMRRVLRGHDKPYAMFEPFGGWPESGRDPRQLFFEDEKVVTHLIDRVAEGARDSGCRFDLFSIDFWHDTRGDLKQADPRRFPNGLEPILRRLRDLGIAPGMWVDSGGIPSWTLGDNPEVQHAFTKGAGKGSLCFATEPVARLYKEAFLYQVRQNGVKQLKFDNFGPGTLEPECNNPKHQHLPGVYSTEAIDNAAIDFYRALAAEDVFISLYWAYRSPWWLLYGDTVFDSGTRIEGASFTAFPAPYARDSTTRRLDQARWVIKDLPPLGWDTLGVWLSDWAWNSRIGKSRWQSGVAMDICRGHLLAQIWSDPDWLSPPERRQMADFIELLKGGATSFRNCRFILGNPWKDEPYGYACSDGQRAFVAINNGVWKDNVFPLELNSAWGLPDSANWDLYRWYPDPVRFETASNRPLENRYSIALRPFEIVLLEVVPAGKRPGLERKLAVRSITQAFAEASKGIELAVSGPPGASVYSIGGQAPASSQGGLLTLSAELRDASGQHWIRSQAKSLSIEGQLAGSRIGPVPVLTEGYPAPWQAWRIGLEPSQTARPFEFQVTTSLPPGVRLAFKAHFIPKDPSSKPSAPASQELRRQ